MFIDNFVIWKMIILRKFQIGVDKKKLNGVARDDKFLPSWGAANCCQKLYIIYYGPNIILNAIYFNIINWFQIKLFITKKNNKITFLYLHCSRVDVYYTSNVHLSYLDVFRSDDTKNSGNTQIYYWILLIIIIYSSLYCK